MSDLSFVVPAVEQADMYYSSHIPVYMYEFSHSSLLANPPWQGSYHTLELEFVFGTPFLNFTTDGGYAWLYTNEDRKVSKKVMKIWSNFIKHG